MKFLSAIQILISLALFAGPAISQARSPNFIVILADDLGYGDLGVYGHPTIQTPRIDRMAAEGVRLTEFYSAAPACTPARAALLTGRYPIRSGLVRVLVPKEKWGIPASEITLAEALREQGYATACIGKWHLGGRRPFRPLRNGFDYFYGLLHSNDMSFLPAVKWPRIDLVRNDKVIESPAKVNTLTRRYTEEAIRYIERHRSQPFFLYLAHTMPHEPVRPSDAFRGKSAHGPYGDVVEEIDWSTGEILGALRRLGLDEDTLVVFTSDNGPSLVGAGNGKQPNGSAGALRGGKATTWEGGMRVPLIARWPGQIPSGTVRDGVATMMDLFTTFLTLAGGRIPSDREIDGKDITPLLNGSGQSPHQALYYYFRSRLFAVREKQWKLHLFKRDISPKGKPQSPVRLRKPELYDLASDPSETQDLAGQHPELVARLAERAQAFHAGIDPVMKLPRPSRSFLSGVFTQAPKSPDKVPK